jgi:MtfA peptidase
VSLARWFRRPQPWQASWDGVVERHVPGWRTLSPTEQDELREMTRTLLRTFRWEAARNFTVDAEMRVVIAANAALAVLVLGADCYRKVTSVIVHPGPITVRGVRAGPVPGVVTDEPHVLDGEAHDDGPVVLSWSAVRYDTRHPARGTNVVLHEFAHRLDMLDGITNGTPPLDDDERTARWAAVCTEAYERLRAGSDPEPVLRSYGAENPAEFFAVATEVFFCRPGALRAGEPALYGVLADFFGQNPADREVLARYP